jgi:hypothetical protein
MPIAPADKSSRHPNHNGKGSHVPRYDSASSDNATFPNRNARQQYGAGANVGPFFHSHRTDLEIGFNNWPLER